MTILFTRRWISPLEHLIMKNFQLNGAVYASVCSDRALYRSGSKIISIQWHTACMCDWWMAGIQLHTVMRSCTSNYVFDNAETLHDIWKYVPVRYFSSTSKQTFVLGPNTRDPWYPCGNEKLIHALVLHGQISSELWTDCSVFRSRCVQIGGQQVHPN